MKTISSHTFKHTLKDIHKHTENRKFCFVIGAGASFKSGVPTGGELAKKWFDEIQNRNSKEEIENWVKENKENKYKRAFGKKACHVPKSLL
jgi:NAD-dependent SIR2 family protein deacetylase